MNLISIISHSTGFIFAAVSLQYLIPPMSLRERLKSDPQFAAEDRALRKRVALTQSLPFLVMAVGQVANGLTVWDYFRPREGNPWVLAFFAAVGVIWVIGVYWVFFSVGARQLSEHEIIRMHSPLGSRNLSPLGIKVIFLLAALASLIGIVMFFFFDLPMPKFPK